MRFFRTPKPRDPREAWPTLKELLVLLVFIVGSMLGTTVVFLYFFDPVPDSVLPGALVFFEVGSLFFAYTTWQLFLVSIKASALQYHACEHKVIRCVSNNLPATFVTLDRLPKTDLFCGGSQLVLWTEVPILAGLSLVLLSWGGLWSWLVVSFLVLGACVVNIFLYKGFYEPLGFSESYSKRKAYVVLLLSAPFWMLPLLADKLLFLREPSDDILQEGVELAQRIYSELGIVPEAES